MSLQKSTQKKLSKATIETLAIIVYHQPVTRPEIEEIRGVSFATNTLEILLELDWVRPAGRKDVPGKPIHGIQTWTNVAYSRPFIARPSDRDCRRAGAAAAAAAAAAANAAADAAAAAAAASGSGNNALRSA